MRRSTYLAATVAAAALVATTATSATAGPPTEQRDEVSMKPHVSDAYQDFVASGAGQLIEQQKRMASPSYYLADIANGENSTGAVAADYWYLRIGLHDDGMSLGPQASLNANLDRLSAEGHVRAVDSELVLNLGHTENVSTDDAFAWMDAALSEAGDSGAAHERTSSGEWWDVTRYADGVFEERRDGSITAAADNGSRVMEVTLDGEPFTVTHYWGFYAETPLSEAQKINIYVPENARDDSATYFRTNNSGWFSNPFRAAMVDGGEYRTGNLGPSTVQGNGTINPDVVGEVLDRGMILVSYGARSRMDPPVDGRYLGHAPAPMSDTKAAIRFLKQNQVYGGLPGDPERVIVTGMSGGGALTSIIAASGNSSDYFDSLAELGALGLDVVDRSYVADENVGDDVFATFSSAPMIEQEVASQAHEWIYHPTRQRVADGVYADAAGIATDRHDPERLAEWQVLASNVLSQDDEYPAYLASLGLEVSEVKRTLLDMVERSLERLLNDGITARPDIADLSSARNPRTAELVVDEFLRYGEGDKAPGFEHLPLDWYKVTGPQGRFDVRIKDSAWSDFSEYTYWTAQFVKHTPATDQDGLSEALGVTGYSESSVYGPEDEPYNHVNVVSWALDPANWELLGVTPSSHPDDEVRRAENREIAVTLFEVSD